MKKDPETRSIRVSISKAGGNASAGAVTYKLALPSVWAQALKITPDDRTLSLTFDGEKIIIERPTLPGK